MFAKIFLSKNPITMETQEKQISKMAADLSFHFTKESPGNQMFNDVKALNKFSHEGFNHFVDLVLHFLTGSTDGEQFQTDLESFAQEQGASLNPLKNITKTLLTFFRSAAKQNLSAQYVQEDMETLGISRWFFIIFAKCRI